MPEIDHDYTSEIICPYCGYEHCDSWEEPDEGTRQCDNEDCGKTFEFLRDVEVTYCTTKKDG